MLNDRGTNGQVRLRLTLLCCAFSACLSGSADDGVKQDGTADTSEGFIREAPLPDGYPAPGPLGVVIEKQYPASRTFWAKGDRAFAMCFAFLKAQSLQMTTPVLWDDAVVDEPEENREEAAADADSENESATRRMHFVLQSPELAQPGRWGPVTVQDMPALRVASVALRGPLNRGTIQRCKQNLRQYLADRPTVQSAGPVRILGYNSPQIPEDQRFWEVQVPIQTVNPPSG